MTHEQIEKIDITFKDLEARDVRVLANADKMLEFIRTLGDELESCGDKAVYHRFMRAAQEYQIYDLLD